MEGHIKITNPLLPLLSLTVASIFLYFPTTNSFINIWTDENNPTYSHGPLLLLVCIFLVFRAWKKNTSKFVIQPSPMGLIFTAITSLVWLAASIGNIQFVQQIALLFIIISIFFSLLGFQQTKLFLLPMLLILFAIPIWGFTNVYLREIAVHSVVYLLNMTGISSISEGFDVLIPAGTFVIVQGCSGQGQLIVALALSCMYAYLHPMRWNTRIILIAAAVITAIITNVLRIYIVVLSGQLTNMQHYFVTTDHVTLGWVVFSFGMFLYFIIANRYLGFTDRSSQIGATSSYGQPRLHESTNPKASFITILLVIIAISIGPMLAHYLENKADARIADTISTSLLNNFGDWQNIVTSNASYRSDWKPDYYGADSHQYGTYRSIDNDLIEIYIYHYSRQHQGKEAVSDNNAVYIEDEWKFISRKTHKFYVNQKPMSVEATVIESAYGSKKLVLKWYSVLGVRTQSSITAKLMNIWGIVTHRPDISAYVIAGDINKSYADTFHTLQKFILDFSRLEKETIQ
jgi:EpsI family protein